MLTERNVPHAVLRGAVEPIHKHHVVERIWQHDHTVWQPRAAEISDRLGWLHLPESMSPELLRIRRFVTDARADGFRNALLLGMGGSSLAAETYALTVSQDEYGLPLTILDTTHPDAVRKAIADTDVGSTLFLVATKSGTTAETLALFRTFYTEAATALSPAQAGQRFVAITDPGSPLVERAEENGFRDVFTCVSDLGGRYSALSSFGLIPAALAGRDIDRLIEDAAAFTARCTETDLQINDPARLGALLGHLARTGIDKATFVLPQSIRCLGPWVEQLLAESTGKRGGGILPLVDEPLADPATYGPDRVFVIVDAASLDSEALSALHALDDAGFPLLFVEPDAPWSLGREFFRWEFATAVAGHLLNVNPFDQPNVESAKHATRTMIDAYRANAHLPQAESVELSADGLDAFLAGTRPPEYVSLQAYVPPSPAIAEQLAALRRTIRNRYRVATTVGYGPRFLHSTGQLHKGDAGRGRFVQLVSDPQADVPIPDTAGETRSSLSFGTLIRAQAAGDRQALLEAGRRVTTVRLSPDPVADLRAVNEDLVSLRSKG